MSNNFRTIGFDKIDNNAPQKFTGYYLGLVGCPHAFSRKELGPILRFMMVRDDGTLLQDVVRQRYAQLTTIAPPTRVQVDVRGKKNSGYETYMQVDLDPLDDKHFQEVLRSAGLQWQGSAAILWGNANCVDLAPVSFYVAKKELDMVYPDQDNSLPLLGEGLQYVRNPMNVMQLTSGSTPEAKALPAAKPGKRN